MLKNSCTADSWPQVRVLQGRTFADFDLLLEVFDNVLLVAVDPPGQTDEDEAILIHTRRVRFYLFAREFFGGCAQQGLNETIAFS
jgi:hypothetical protein